MVIAKNGIDLCDRFVKSIKTSFRSENDDDLIGALTNASMSRHVEKLSNMIAANLKGMRDKYEHVFLAITNPALASQKEAEQQIKAQRHTEFALELDALGINEETANMIFADRFSEATSTLMKTNGISRVASFGIVCKAGIALKEKYPEKFEKKKSGCFVATACYGNYDHPIVMELRNFRDDYLEISRAGRLFIQWYYKWSPPFANLIDKSAIFKVLARVLIVAPTRLLAQLLNHRHRKI